MTAEQVCRALNARVRGWLQHRRGTRESEIAHATIRYHQARNAAAKRSRFKYRKGRIQKLLAL